MSFPKGPLFTVRADVRIEIEDTYSPMSEGDRVEAFFETGEGGNGEGQFFGGRITAINSKKGTYHVVFDDDDKGNFTSGELRRELVSHTAVDVWQPGRGWTSGQVERAVGNGVYSVRLQDGSAAEGDREDGISREYIRVQLPEGTPVFVRAGKRDSAGVPTGSAVRGVVVDFEGDLRGKATYRVRLEEEEGKLGAPRAAGTFRLTARLPSRIKKLVSRASRKGAEELESVLTKIGVRDAKSGSKALLEDKRGAFRALEDTPDGMAVSTEEEEEDEEVDDEAEREEEAKEEERDANRLRRIAAEMRRDIQAAVQRKQAQGEKTPLRKAFMTEDKPVRDILYGGKNNQKTELCTYIFYGGGQKTEKYV